ncbi:hypothetical protein CYMTET_5183 [Cymbomonas tetramitiformis]|uniref:Uncharacterized protein n=1 Tax=Cymbomonas tetramitiformis TaxID=36881 RepID=A0AAE0LJQ4_9CHLO|nr:hypothetical protein CYMTET_5183 [Cymbomonas tetramitiformis]
MLKYLEDAQFFTSDSLDRLKAALKKRQQDEESAWLQDQTPNQTREVSGQQAKDHTAEEDAAAELHIKEQEKVEEVASLMEDLNNMSEGELQELLQEKKEDHPQLVQDMMQLLQVAWGPREQDIQVIQDFTGPDGEQRRTISIQRELMLKEQPFILLCFKEADVYGQPHVVGVAWLKKMWQHPEKTSHELENRVAAFNPRRCSGAGSAPK